MLPQDAPAPSHRCHWYWNDVGLFVQVPFCAVSVSPTFGVPVIDGKVVLAGGAAAAVAAQTKTAPAVIAKEVRMRLVFTRSLSWVTSFKREKKRPGCGFAVKKP
jgi:hypothetical protein